MIAYIKGKIIELKDTHICVLTNSGIGYDVLINDSTHFFMKSGEEVEMYIHHHIAEGAQVLYGFLNLEEKQIFKELIKISGVGGKVALSILNIGISSLIVAVNNEDNITIEQIKGIGKKMASKIILELKDKDFVKSFDYKVEQSNTKEKINDNKFNQIKSTLVNIGYNSKGIEEILNNLPEETKTTQDIIQYVIKNI